jgi:hypothetical protein
MARSKTHNALDPFVKYTIFRNAFGQVIKFQAEQNLLAAHVLAFSILEDRVTAAYVSSYRLLHEMDPPQIESLQKIKFKNLVSNLHVMGVIEQSLEQKIYLAGDLRNELLHEMMWRLDCFTQEAINEIRKLITQVQTANRRFVKKQNEQRKVKELHSRSKGFGKRVVSTLNKAVIAESKKN